MEENKAVQPGAALDAEQINQVAGGDGTCSTTLTMGTDGITLQTTGSSVGDTLINTYDGVVDATSHVIETVAKSF